tara:strand:+ start:396 stop:716 length:321 start_codon:yes stop_codon:yes gene_type:complete
MANKTIIEYHGPGYIYDNGEIPSCDYCGKDETETSCYPTAHSGVMCCQDQECMNGYMNDNVLCEGFTREEKTVTICDTCSEEKSDFEEFHDIDGEEICDYCYEDNK